MAHLAFFYSGEVEADIDDCLDLALIYKCDPFVFLSLPRHAVDMLYSRTIVRLKMAQES